MLQCGMYIPKVIQKYTYQALVRDESSGIRHYRTPEGDLVPSVTTVLSSTKDSGALDAWVERVGAVEAERIRTESARIGTGMHNNLENILLGKEQAGGVLERTLADLIVKRGFPSLQEVWAVEASLYSKALYAGTTDLVAVHKNGQPTIADFKNSRRPKRAEWIDDYRAQLAAYALAHNEMFGTDIRQGLVMVATWTGEYQEFLFTGLEFDRCVDLWLGKLDAYYAAR
jgi:ATP-dependent exoDNAse (exonuclease V) beta subunit